MRRPVKTIPVVIVGQVGLDVWPYSSGDAFWVGGAAPRYYTWKLTLSVKPQTHSSNMTTIPYEYNGFDINVGDWIARTASGLALQVVSVLKKTRYEVEIVAEDVNRYNTIISSKGTANGELGRGAAVIFKLDNEGEPIIAGTTATSFSPNAEANLDARFQSLNLENNFKIHKPAHGFVVGDLIAADSTNNTFIKATSSAGTVIGMVTIVGPGPDYFYVSPKQKVIDNFDFLIGEPGDPIYLDSSGNLTTTSTTQEIYVKLRNNTKTFSISDEANVGTTPGYSFSINGTVVTVSGSGSLTDVIQAVNAVQATTGVIAYNDNNFLKLEAVDARAITLRNVTGYPLETLKIASSENGTKAAAMIVEKSVSFSSGITVVADIAARDALSPVQGSLAYVADAGGSEWAMFVYDNAWVNVGSTDSARSDANSLQVSIFGTSSASTLVGNLSAESRVTLITVEVVDAFDVSATLTIGNSVTQDLLMDNNLVDLTSPGIYTTQSEYLFDGPSDENVFAYFSQTGSLLGHAIVTISYM